MQSPIWVLEQHEDTREMILASLSQAGMWGVGFRSVAELVAHAANSNATPVRAAFVDAMTALDHESAIHAALGSRVIVFTTWPSQTLPWVRVGVSSFLVKPFELGTLPELARRPAPALSKCARPHEECGELSALGAVR
jgi:DNA-binding NtrC family response regulator